MGTEFRLLGQVEALVDGHPLDIGHARQRAVLAVLLVEVNRPVPTGVLIDRVWAEQPPLRARNALSAYLSRLRHLLAAAGDVRIARRHDAYELSVDALSVDLHLFRGLAARARTERRPAEAVALYARALALWRGEPFAGADAPWFAGLRVALDAERLAVELDRNDAALRAGRHGELLAELATAARAHPLDERLAGQLMLAQFRSGRQAAALETYRQVRGRLRDELGADPGAALRAVHRQILTGDAERPPEPPQRVAGPPPELTPAAPLERAEPLRRLDGLLAAGAGRVVLVSGEAGVGKTTLVTAFAARAAGDVLLLWGSCDPLLTPRELGPLHDVGRQTGGALAAALAGDARRETVFAAVLDELDAASDRPRPVLVIEDVHWADGATLDLLTFLGRRIARTRSLLVVTFRDDEIGAEHPLHAALATLPREVVVRLPLAPLSPDGVAELARRAGRPATDVHAVTGGNPLLVSELLAAGPSDVPPTVRDLMLARLGPLPEPARAVARLVSVLPGYADPAVLAGAAAAVETCLARGVLVAREDRVAYRHELLRRAVEESLSPVRRAELHATALAALERAEESADPARLAHHARLAGDVGALLRHAPAAARRAAAVDARREAVGHLRAVLPHVDRLAGTERAELRQEFAAQAFAAGFAEEGLAELRRALAHWEAVGDAERTGEALLLLNRIHWWSGRVDEAWAACHRAVEVLETVPPGRPLARAYGQLSTRYMLTNRPSEALDWGRRASALATRLGDVATTVDGLITVGGARFDLEPEWDGSELEQAHAAAAAAGLPDQATRALVNLASTTLQRGRHGRAEPLLDRALRVAVDRDLHGYARFTTGLRARLRVERGDWDGARSDAATVLDGVGIAGNARLPGLVALALLRLRRGEDGALALLDEAADYAYPMREMQWVGPVAAARSELFWLNGDTARAAAEARRWLPLAVRRHRWLAGELALRLWRAEPGVAAPAGIDRPYALLVDGDWAGAAAIWADRGCVWTRAEALACGDAEAVAEAVALAESLGAAPVARRWRLGGIVEHRS
ncbi:BTAD domain-containing putative transcriptional regulator [Pseudonocardia kunmingensis]|uniref:DNA-binding SARP family transcriptional activator n=1 Tax=Pseudonocardia kunmingensis TaxID=630975 RepID=A0A543CXM9_9PSEU|nr:BTAD domain-containing putative transcriptional regulator [Pseudonocardia kunmingensis]TQM01840.1 DNA-binding SARP family transcriptional activator [Pseudonocardia kunmingensis]